MQEITSAQKFLQHRKLFINNDLVFSEDGSYAIGQLMTEYAKTVIEDFSNVAAKRGWHLSVNKNTFKTEWWHDTYYKILTTIELYKLFESTT